MGGEELEAYFIKKIENRCISDTSAEFYVKKRLMCAACKRRHAIMFYALLFRFHWFANSRAHWRRSSDETIWDNHCCLVCLLPGACCSPNMTNFDITQFLGEHDYDEGDAMNAGRKG